jgi:CubicO group peptidase (beta-lactamase class C family)
MSGSLEAALELVRGWGAERVAVAVVGTNGVVASVGDPASLAEWASVTKLVTAYAVLRAVERGDIALDEPYGPPAATVRHLLAHASGLGPEGSVPISAPERTRIYSNVGYDLLGTLLEERSGRPITTVLEGDVLEPLGMTETQLFGRPSAGVRGSLDDLARFARELLRPSLTAPGTLAAATTVAFPGLAGVLPGIGRFDPLDWGLGFELRNGKDPHWTGTRNSPATFGHFGASGTFVWVDPVADVALACLTERPFGPWALAAWPALSDAVLQAAAGV